jgi:glycosyltransferase involved in cell wall biosynthesis
MARIAIITQDFVGESMAGPAIRAWEFAKALSKDHEVTLVTHNESNLTAPFTILSSKQIKKDQFFRNQDVLITQFLTAGVAYYAKKHGVKIVIDAYCPTVLEAYEIFKHQPLSKRHKESDRQTSVQKFSFELADYIICASEKQRDFWLGALVNHNCIKSHHYDADPSLRQYIDVVPFGLASKGILQKNGPGPREIFGLKPTDKIVLWGGSISNWFDPITLIKAFERLAPSRPDIKLVFMGVVHPNPKIPKMEIGEQAMKLAEEKGLLNNTVFFNQKWYPYNQRHNFLQEASIGISIHPLHLETRFSFRTRILDYIWAKLPIITTEGDVFADLVNEKELGIVVPYYDDHAIANAILEVVDNPTLSQKCQQNLTKLQITYNWNEVLKPLQQRIPNLLNEKSDFTFNNQLSIINNIIKRSALRYF